MQKIVSLNLNGIRAAWRKNLAAWIYSQQNLPDVICFQEIKAQIPDLSDEMINPKNYHAYYFAAEKKVIAALACGVKINRAIFNAALICLNSPNLTSKADFYVPILMNKICL